MDSPTRLNAPPSSTAPNKKEGKSQQLSLPQNFDFSTFSLWHVIVDFLDLRNLLAARQVCHNWQQGIEQGLSLGQCVSLLAQRSQRDNLAVVFGLTNTAWSSQLGMVQQRQSLRQLLESTVCHDTAGSSKWDTVLRIFRVMHHFPWQMSVCFNETWGRHCVGVEWSPSKGTSVPILYPDANHQQSLNGSTSSQTNNNKKMSDEENNQETHSTKNHQLPTDSNHNVRHTSEVPSQEADRDPLDYDIHDTLQLQNPRTRQPWDLKSYYYHQNNNNNNNIPNLPSDLACPVCGNTSSLQLSEFSYHGKPNTTTTGNSNNAANADIHNNEVISPLGYRASNILTLTPHPPAVVEEVTAVSREPIIDDETASTTSEPSLETKRPRLQQEEEEEEEAPRPSSTPCFFPPPSYQDLCLPILRNNEVTNIALPENDNPGLMNEATPTPTPLHPKAHVKHCMTISCENCHDFALVAPAGLCWSSRFPCKARSQTFCYNDVNMSMKKMGSYHHGCTITTTTTTTYIGGTLVRTKCTEPACLRPVYCHDCSHATHYTPYPTANNNGPNDTITDDTVHRILHGIRLQHSSRCDSCRLDYCPAHAWLSTVCHHW